MQYFEAVVQAGFNQVKVWLAIIIITRSLILFTGSCVLDGSRLEALDIVSRAQKEDGDCSAATARRCLNSHPIELSPRSEPRSF